MKMGRFHMECQCKNKLMTEFDMSVTLFRDNKYYWCEVCGRLLVVAHITSMNGTIKIENLWYTPGDIIKAEKQKMPGLSRDNRRALAYRFFMLPYPTRIKILVKLNLLIDDDDGIEHTHLIDTLIERARLKKNTSLFIDEVSRAYIEFQEAAKNVKRWTNGRYKKNEKR
jgi:hypothetical protein